MKKWKKLSTKLLFEHPRIKLWEDSVQLPSGKTTTYLHFGTASDAATIIAIRDDGKLFIQKEYSYPPNEWLLQFPGGGIERGENPKQGALRELSEEAGLTGDLEDIGWYYPNNRRSPARMHVYMATNLTKKQSEGDDEELFENFWMSESEIEEKIVSGEARNYSLLAAWTLYKAKKRSGPKTD